MRVLLSGLIVCAAAIGSTGTAQAGFLDAFNQASQAVSQVENAKNTAQRARNLLESHKKQAAPPAVPKPAPVAASAGAISDKDRTAIERAKRAWVAAFKAEDWDALVDQYASNAVLLAPDEQSKAGPAEIRAYFANDEDTLNEEFRTVEIRGDGNMAFAQGVFAFDIKSKSGSAPAVKASGKYIEIWEKQADGNWLITRDIWNATPFPVGENVFSKRP